MHAQERSLYLALLVTMFVLLGLVAFYTATLIRQQRRNRRLFQEKVAAEIHTLEKERQRLAEDMHDELGPVVAGIKLKLNSIDALSDIDRVTLDKVQENMGQLLGRLKGISNNLMPAVLLKKGLVPAVQALVDEFQGANGMKINFQAGRIPEVPKETRVNLYRVCQELLANTLKHAEASEFSLSLSWDGQLFKLQASDNGKGFEQAAAVARSTGYGMHNLLNRTELMGGQMFLKTSPGEGTQYQFEIPVKEMGEDG